MPTLLTLCAVSTGLGLGAICATTALQDFFMSDFFGRAAANDGGPVCRRRFGRSGGDLEPLLRHQASEQSVGLDPVETIGEGVDAAVHLHEILLFDPLAAKEFATPCSVGALDASVEFGRSRRYDPDCVQP